MITEINSNIAPLFSIETPDFDSSKLSTYTLCLEIGIDRFSFCVTQASNNECLWLEDYSFGSLLGNNSLISSLDSLYRQHRFLKSNSWKNIKISFNTPYFTLIPTDFFRKEYVANYLNLVQDKPVTDTEQILSSAVLSINAKNIFAIEKNVWEWLLNMYALHAPTIHHQADSLILAALKKTTTKDKAVAILHFEDEFVTMVVSLNKQLLICNKFAYKVASDMTYFVLFVLDNLQIKPDKIDCKLSGEITPYSDIYESLSRFLPHISFCHLPKGFATSEPFEDLPEHRYLSLYYNCLI